MTAPPLTFRGRLPGVDCQPALPAAEQPIRLDVAGFVGFAERGPVDLPVAVEDINQYLAIFGGDLALAADAGQPVYAHLPATVRSFFDNGGRRCHVVRVAGPACSAAVLPVPGLRAWYPDGTIESVSVAAAWPGSWSDGVQIGTQLSETPIAVARPYHRSADGEPGLLTISARFGRVNVVPGDLIRLDPGPSAPQLILRVATVGVVEGNVLIAERTLTIDAEIAIDATGPQPIAAVAALPTDIPVEGAWLQRMDVVVRQHTDAGDVQLERWPDAAFNGEGPAGWRAVLQPPDVSVAPDAARSLTLRALPDAGDGVYLPVGMDQLGGPAELESSPPLTVPGSDDLDSYDPVACYLDPQLADDTFYTVLADIGQLTLYTAPPLRLRGIHALAEIDEIALMAVPDAVHRSWSPAAVPVTVPPPPPPPPPPPVDTSRFHCCDQPQPPEQQPTDTLGGPEPDLDEVAKLPVLDDVDAFDEAPMLRVQTALVELCAARADAVAVLCLPQHYDAVRAIEWQSRFTSQGRLSASGAAVAPLSYAGYWHPWPQVLEPRTPQLEPLRSLPPDGLVCGMIAARELSRGVWVAPANRPLRGPAALTPTLSSGEVTRLFNAHANVLVRQPGVVTTTSAHTLAEDRAQLQLSVRRLLILIRKIALRYGQRYVFEVNNDRFRRLVHLRFTRILESLARRGAFLAYRVVTDGGVNTARDLDAGRLIVSLQVAPSDPVEFITVSLTRSGEGLLDVVEAGG